MNSRFNILKKLLLITVCVFAVACQDTIPNRSLINSGSSTGDPVCTEVDSEVTEFLPKCEEKPAVTRPTDAVLWKSDFCACKDSKPVSYGNCSSFCSGKKTNGAETLFANFTVTEAISLSGLGNLQAWCELPLPGETANPSCELQAKDEQGNISSLEVLIPKNSNSLTANIQGLQNNKTYIFTLVVKDSPAKSNSIQMIKFDDGPALPSLGTLKKVLVSQYTCMVREFSTDDSTGDIYYDTAYRMHFYYIPRLPPAPIPGGNSNLICHDIFNPRYGAVDSELYPRFENISGIFNLWDSMDPRFYDNDGNGNFDVNDAIVQKTKNFGGSIPASTNFFAKFSWPGGPNLSTDAGNTQSTTPMGFYMAPWIDQQTFKSYCLTQEHYSGSNPLFKAMRDIVGVDTEGLYIGEKSAETVIGGDGRPTIGFKDYILIRETDLKAVWFYLNGTTPTAPTEANVAGKPIYFYYPLNRASPFIQSSTQRLYRVRGADELSNVSKNGATDTGVPTSYPPHDRKIGCVPKF